jgi:hypothetical protein
MWKSLAVALVCGGAAALPLTADSVISSTYSIYAGSDGTGTASVSLLPTGDSVGDADNALGVTSISFSSSLGEWYGSYNLLTNLNPDYTFDSPLTIELANFSATCFWNGCGENVSVTVNADFDLAADSAINSPWYTLSATGSGGPIDVTTTVNGTEVDEPGLTPDYTFSTSGSFGAGPVTDLSIAFNVVGYPLGNVSLNNLTLTLGEAPPSVPEIGSGLLVAAGLAGTFAGRRFWRRRRG